MHTFEHNPLHYEGHAPPPNYASHAAFQYPVLQPQMAPGTSLRTPPGPRPNHSIPQIPPRILTGERNPEQNPYVHLPPPAPHNIPPRIKTPGSQISRENEIRLYVTLRQESEEDVEYQKLITMIRADAKISELKRKIEKEFIDLFPGEQHFIVAKLQDEYGYSLSNSSIVGDVLKNADRVTALPEEAFYEGRKGGKPPLIHGNQDPYDLVSLLYNVQQSVVSKLAQSQVHEFRPFEDLLMAVLPLGFSRDPTTVQNASIVLNKALHQGNVGLFNNPKNTNLVILAREALRYWIENYTEKDGFILTNAVEILDVLSHSHEFIAKFKGESCISKLLALTKFPDTPGPLKSKIFRAISHLSQAGPHSSGAAAPPISKDHKPMLGNVKSNYQQPVSDNTVQDYCMMLYADENTDVALFAIQNLANVIDGGIRQIMVNSERFLGALRVIEYYNFPREVQLQQAKIMSTMASHMNQARAFDALKVKFLTKITKAYNYFDPSIRESLKALLSSILAYGKHHIDVPSLISLTLCSYPELQLVGITMMNKVAEALVSDSSNRSPRQFESHLSFLVEAASSNKRPNQFRNQALSTLAHLSLKDLLKPHILHNRGLQAFIKIVKEPFDDNTEGKRIAAKGLVNLTSNKRELRMKAVSELGDMVKQLYRNEVDSIVGAYLQTLIHKNA